MLPTAIAPVIPLRPDPLLAIVREVVGVIHQLAQHDIDAYTALLRVLGAGATCDPRTSTPDRIVERTREIQNARRGAR